MMRTREFHTIALANSPVRPHLPKVFRGLLSKGSSTAEDEAHAAEVVLGALSLATQHVDHDRGHEGHLLNLEPLNSRQEHLEFKAWENDGLVAVVQTCTGSASATLPYQNKDLP